jgi:hypothetical protein
MKEMPAGIITNLQLLHLAKRMRIPFFRGVYMRNALPRKIRRNENSIVNLDDAAGSGTHWVAYSKRDDRAAYFDSFGNLGPPKEIVRYLGTDTLITYNRTAYQTYDQTICGQLCLLFLQKIDLKIEPSSIDIFALQTDRKNVLSENAAQFDACKLTNVRLHLNSDFYPYDDMNLDFDKDRFAILYNMYTRFRKVYYGCDDTYLDVDDF